MIIVGSDPGFTGAAAAIGLRAGSNFPRVIDVYDFRTIGDGGAKRIDIKHFRDWLREMRGDGEARAYLERATSMRAPADEQGNRAKMHEGFIGRYMKTAGHIEATILCADYDLRLVQAAQWKRIFDLLKQNKRASIHAAIELFPEAANWISLVKHHNRAEAVLIGGYGAIRSEMMSVQLS